MDVVDASSPFPPSTTENQMGPLFKMTLTSVDDVVKSHFEFEFIDATKSPNPLETQE